MRSHETENTQFYHSVRGCPPGRQKWQKIARGESARGSETPRNPPTRRQGMCGALAPFSPKGGARPTTAGLAQRAVQEALGWAIAPGGRLPDAEEGCGVICHPLHPRARDPAGSTPQAESRTHFTPSRLPVKSLEQYLRPPQILTTGIRRSRVGRQNSRSLSARKPRSLAQQTRPLPRPARLLLACAATGR